MASSKKPTIALIYDFDGTLAPGNMQEYELLKKLGIKPKDFWKESHQRAKEHDMDTILSYMTLMIEKCKDSKKVKYTKTDMVAYGKTIELYEGVTTWFDRINLYAKSKGFKPVHYVVSSGIKEMIEGTSIAKKFTWIYASSYKYDHNGVPEWPALSINYSAKTQFIFRINKGVMEVWDNTKINDAIPDDERDVPYEHMFFFGDGLTDVPCMKLVKDNGGMSFAVYKGNSSKGRESAISLLKDKRVNAIFPANYTAESQIEKAVKARIDELAARVELKKLTKGGKNG